jgi:hypothetical protein
MCFIITLIYEHNDQFITVCTDVVSLNSLRILSIPRPFYLISPQNVSPVGFKSVYEYISVSGSILKKSSFSGYVCMCEN